MPQINTNECEACKFCELEEVSKAKILVHCSIKKKTYYYGQSVPCDFKEKRDNNGKDS